MVRETQIPTETRPAKELVEWARKFSNGLDLEINDDSFEGVYNVYDLIQTCSARTKFSPEWGILGGRMMMHEIRKTCGKTFSESVKILEKQMDNDYFNFVMENAEELDAIIEESRSDNRQCISVATCLKSYLIRYNKCGGCNKCDDCDKLYVGETIEHMYMRAAVFINMPDIDTIRDVYNALSKGEFSHATPTFFNAGTKRSQMASCFVAVIQDSLRSIEDFMVAFAEISRNAGGIGCDFSKIRHSLIGSVGTSDGVPALLPVYQSILQYVDQSKKRKGSAVASLAIWHIDIETVIKMKDPKGAESDITKCLDLSYAAWINDLFMERVRDEKDWSLFCPKKCPKLTECDGDDFRQVYEQYEKDGLASKVIKARDLMVEIINVQFATGMPYILNGDMFNKCSMQENIGRIRSSNLCVSGDTKILTDRGQIEIQKLQDQKINVWNGEEFSKTVVRKTGEDQEMVKVKMSNGSVLTCTPYHTFYIQEKMPRYVPKNMYENEKYVKKMEAKDLKEGMKIIKCEYPVLDSKRRFPYAYTHGAFCGDGTYERPRDLEFCGDKTKFAFCKRHSHHADYYDLEPTGKCQAKLGNIPRLSLYGEKICLANKIDYRNIRNVNDKQNRVDCVLHLDLPKKFTVPMNYSLQDKLDWFAGYCDMDGTIARNGTNESLQVCSIEYDFINDVKLMLQTMGCDPKVTKNKNEQYRDMPDGHGGMKKYLCKSTYRLLVNSNDLYHLHTLGFKPNRLVYTQRVPQRKCKQFIKITSVEHLDERMDTYCFTEKKRGMGIFNGIITGQCSEIALHTNEKEIASCNLASLCLPKFVNPDKTYNWKRFGEVVRMVVRVMDNVIDRNYYPDRSTEKMERNKKMIEKMLEENNADPALAQQIIDNLETNEILQNIKNANFANRPLGLGVQGFGDALAKMDVLFDGEEAAEFNNRMVQTMYYNAVDESANLARERGSYPRFEGSPYSKGQLHPDRWEAPCGDKTKFLDDFDWDGLREKVKGGMRHSTLLAFMPTATSSIIAGNSPSFEPINVIIGTKTILSGQHVVLCQEAYNDLKKLGVWNERMVDEIVSGNKGKFGDENGVSGIGGIQHLSMPPEIEEFPLKRARFRYLQRKYRTGYELSAKTLIDHSADRTPFICQSQSLNLWSNKPSTLNSLKMYLYAWKKGLKTMVYYFRGTSSLNARNIKDACEGGSCSA